MTTMKPESEIHQEWLNAWQKAYSRHMNEIGPHPMCIVCTEIENSIQHRVQSLKILARGGRTLPRYIAAIH